MSRTFRDRSDADSMCSSDLVMELVQFGLITSILRGILPADESDRLIGILGGFWISTAFRKRIIRKMKKAMPVLENWWMFGQEEESCQCTTVGQSLR